MPEYKTLQGILALVDIVNFTGQATKLGKKNTAEFTEYFQGKIAEIAQRYNYTVVKSLGDAVLVFGTGPEEMLDIALDLFERDKLEDIHGFVSRFRMVAHSGFFQFQTDGDKLTDLVSPEGIKVFRLEKHAQTWELVVTQPLFQGLKSMLTEKHLEASHVVLDEPLKGFDNEEWSPPFFKLRIAGEEGRTANLLERRLEDLENNVKTIPVFGSIYPPVPMDKNFINLSLVCDHDTPDDACPPNEKEEKRKKRSKHKDEEWPYHDMEEKTRARLKEIDVPTFYDKYRKGFILGLPGAGKTTILRHIAHKEFTANRTLKEDKKRLALFVPCSRVPHYDAWYKKRHGTKPPEPNAQDVLEFMTWVFLFGDSDDVDSSPNLLDEYQSAYKKVKQAFARERLTLLVDALDEAADSNTRERIKQLYMVLAETDSQNRFYLTSRPSEMVHLPQEFEEKKIPVFKVLNLTPDQVRAVAKHLMDEDSAIYIKFDKAIWQEVVVAKMAATPITALLITAYFQAYEIFDHRYPMYDLLVKFILLKVWEGVKTGTFPYKNMELFFKEVKNPGFFKEHRETRTLYDALAALCFALFYDSADGTVQRSVNEATLLMYFSRFIRQYMPYYDEEAVKTEAHQWKERFHKDHLLLQAGKQEYVFVHSTVMEYLAAYYMVEEYKKDNGSIPGLLGKCMKKADYLQLETLPIAVGSSLLTGYAFMAVLKDLKTDYGREPVMEQGVKCLSEVEWLLKKTLEPIRIASLRDSVTTMVSRNRESVRWTYQYVKELMLTGEKDRLKKALDTFHQQLKLSQDAFFREYLDYKSFNDGDSELVELRKQLLRKLVQEELVKQWLDEHQVKIAEENVLQLDTTGYHPEDKHFNYYRDIVGKELAGFYGSPNMKHSGEVNASVFSPDGKTVASASRDGTLKLWEVATGKEIRTFTGHNHGVNACAFAPDGLALASASRDGTLKLWEVATGKEIRTFTGHKDYIVYACAFAPDGLALASASDDGTLKLWEVATGKEIRTFTGHKGTVLACAFAPDGLALASASDDGTLKLWEVATGKEIRTFTGHKDYVYSCAFAPDGLALASASIDGTLKLWDPKTGQCIKSLNLPWKPWAVSFSPTTPGQVITANLNGTVTLFDLL